MQTIAQIGGHAVSHLVTLTRDRRRTLSLDLDIVTLRRRKVVRPITIVITGEHTMRRAFQPTVEIHVELFAESFRLFFVGQSSISYYSRRWRHSLIVYAILNFSYHSQLWISLITSLTLKTL